jgi:hypothetical protein
MEGRAFWRGLTTLTSTRTPRHPSTDLLAMTRHQALLCLICVHPSQEARALGDVHVLSIARCPLPHFVALPLRLPWVV